MLAHLQASKLSGAIRESISEHLAKDLVALPIIQLAKEGKTCKFLIENNLLLTKENRLYVSHSGNMRRLLLKECHETLWAGHNGWKRTYVILKR